MSRVDADKPVRLSLGSVMLYVLLIAAAIAGFYLFRHLGRDLVAPAPAGSEVFGTGDPKLKFDVLVHVLLALAVIIVTARLLGALFAKLRQPPVIGEVLAGILLGPSLLGRVAPSVSGYLLPISVSPFLSILAQVGVILYMFLVGLELDTGLLRKRTHATVAVSHASIVLPFVLGCALALLLYPRLSSSDVPFTYFALFCGVAMSVTAFPVLARILTDRGAQTSHLGVTALACAAVDDVTAWCLLAFVVSVVKARAAGGLLTAGLTLGYIALIISVRPLLLRLIQKYDRDGGVSRNVLTAVVLALLLSALATEYIGIHAVFGAFALGAIIPADSKIARELLHRLEDFVVVLFLPTFFAYTGMRTHIGLVGGASEWLLCLLIIVTACVGKFGGSFAEARISGIGWRDSAALGVLMNTRGLMELIVLNIGLDLKVISPILFAMLVIMAIVTTMATTPILDLLTAGSERVSRARTALASRIS
ncbi:MAG TPA: cation:proton antiporter [Polyangia bacterium]|nr:cation:proton antiporter [Polyangia bacterium]